jgi:hypothetical protein
MPEKGSRRWHTIFSKTDGAGSGRPIGYNGPLLVPAKERDQE